MDLFGPAPMGPRTVKALSKPIPRVFQLLPTNVQKKNAPIAINISLNDGDVMASLLVVRITQPVKLSNVKSSRAFNVRSASQIFLRARADLEKSFMGARDTQNATSSLGISLDLFRVPSAPMPTWVKRSENLAAKILSPSCFVLNANTKNRCLLKETKKQSLEGS